MPPTGGLEPQSSAQATGRRLDSWKEIAAYLNRSERTVRRWEKDEGLPVHRLQHEKRGSVYGYTYELDAWWESRKRSIEAEPASATEVEAAESSPRAPARKSVRAGIWIGIAGTSILLTTAVGALVRPSPPRVLRIAQLTHSGRVDTGPTFVTDGARLYFTERLGGQWTLHQVSIHGGDPVLVPTPFASTTLFDISPDHTSLLIGNYEGQRSSSVWILPVVGGPPRRLGDLNATDARWTPDGQELIYTNGPALSLANSDGSGSREIVRLNGVLNRPRVDPKGGTIRFTQIDDQGNPTSIWEVRFDGTGLKRLSPIAEFANGALEGESDAAWTPDGKYFLFRSHSSAPRGGHRSGLWTIREAGIMSAGRRRPFPLYLTPMAIAGPAASPDGSRLYFIGKQERYELVQFETSRGAFVPHLSGLSAAGVSFSRDGNWIVYFSLPDRGLWRSRADGSDRRQLVASLRAFHPRWSPDGVRIAFMGTRPGTSEQAIYIVDRDGGTPKQVVDNPCDNPTWSPDGQSLTFMRPDPDGALWQLHLSNGTTVRIPGSEHLTSPAWSPDGRYLAAIEDGRKLMLLDRASSQWSTLVQGVSVGSIRWSHDGRGIYFQDVFGGASQPVYRIAAPGGVRERVTPLQLLIADDVIINSFCGITPAGNLLFTLIRNNSDLYAVDVDFGK